MWQCKHCSKGFEDITLSAKANHSRWCEHNPKRSSYKTGSAKAVAAMNEKRKQTGLTNQFTKAKLEGKPIPEGTMKGKPGSFLGKKHNEETRQLMSKKAISSTHRRLRRKMIEYNGVMLDSTWELELAKRLDELGIDWIRPEPIKWTDSYGVERNYFPDFYLKDYDIFLDPKNPYAIKAQQEKLERLLEQHNNIIIIKTLEECKNYSPTEIAI